MDDLSDSCIDNHFQREYHSAPYVFTSIEIVGNISTSDPPALVWVKQVSSLKTTVCVRSSQIAKYRIHLIVNGTIGPCSNFSCPNHLECQLDSASMPYCGCIRNCARYNDTREFCGSDYRNYQSVCLMNKEHCHRYGNKSKSNVTVNHYGKCQGLLWLFLIIVLWLFLIFNFARWNNSKGNIKFWYVIEKENLYYMFMK